MLSDLLLIYNGLYWMLCAWWTQGKDRESGEYGLADANSFLPDADDEPRIARIYTNVFCCREADSLFVGIGEIRG